MVRQRTSFKYEDEWGFSPSPDTRASVPTITDDLYPLLQSGRVGERLYALNIVCFEQ
jgi:hypothetical protein